MSERKVALVTGGASGIGLATAVALGEAGYHVVIGDITKDAGEKACADLVSRGLSATFAMLDVSSEEQWAAAAELISTQCGRLDVLVNNAGIGAGGSYDTTELTQFNQVMLINVAGVFLGCKYSIPLMEKSDGGSVINISSVFGIVADQLTMVYSASKGAVRAMTKSIALDCASRGNGVRVNSVHPGFIETPMVTNANASVPEDIATEYTARTVGQTPMGRMGQPQELANVIVFLASDGSSFMTGSEVVVDGGFAAH